MKISKNFTNSTSLTRYELCEIEHDIGSINELFTCYFYLFQFSIAESSFGLIVLFGVCIANFLVIALIAKNHTTITLFDQIIIGHCKKVKFFNIEIRKLLFFL